jgi:hypothetical protein
MVTKTQGMRVGARQELVNQDEQEQQGNADELDTQYGELHEYKVGHEYGLQRMG